MGAELGATTSVFPFNADAGLAEYKYLAAIKRTEITADAAKYNDSLLRRIAPNSRNLLLNLSNLIERKEGNLHEERLHSGLHQQQRRPPQRPPARQREILLQPLYDG